MCTNKRKNSLADEENQMVIITKTQNESGLQGGNKSDQIVEKGIALTMAAAMAVSLTACGGGNSSSGGSKEAGNTPAADAGGKLNVAIWDNGPEAGTGSDPRRFHEGDRNRDRFTGNHMGQLLDTFRGREPQAATCLTYSGCTPTRRQSICPTTFFWISPIKWHPAKTGDG